MFILLGYLSIALVQLYRQYRRQTHYASIMLRALRNGSVLVQRGKCVQRGSVGALMNSSLLSCSQSYKESQLLSDEHLAVSVVSPKQKVDLGEWTSYLDLHPAQEDSHSVIVLLEARSPHNEDAFLTAAKNIPLAYQVHVLKHGCPIAWKSGSPFGIILHCSYRDFILLCDAFGQGRLTLDEDLELYHLMTVSTMGKPRSLRQTRDEEAAAATAKNDLQAKQAIREDAEAKKDLEAKQASLPLAPGLVSAESESPLCAAAADRSHDLVSGMLKTKRQGQEISTTEAPKDADAGHLNQPNGQISAGNGIADQPFWTSVNGTELSTGGQNSESDCRPLNGAGSVAFHQTASEKIDSGSATEIADNKAKFANSDSLVTIGKGSQQGFKTSTDSIESDGKEMEVLDVAESPNSLLSKSEDAQTLKPEPVESPSNSPNDMESPVNSPNDMESPVNRPNNMESPVNSAEDTEFPCNSANGTESPGNGANNTTSGSRSSQEKRGGKPPNVVVYCGKKDSARKFDIIKTGLEQCLNTDAYTIYILPHEEIMTIPWEDNAAALIISHDYLHDNIRRKCTDFLTKGGKVISFGSSMEAEFVVRKEVQGQPTVAKFSLGKWQDVSAIQGRYCYVHGGSRKADSSLEALVVDPKSGDPLVVKLMLSGDSGSGRAIFSQLFLERDPGEMAVDSKTFSRLKQSNAKRLKMLQHLLSLLELDTSVAPSHALTPCYILVQEQTLKTSLLDSIAGRMKQGSIKARNLTLKFVSATSGSSALTATSECLPVIMDHTRGSSQGMGDAGNIQFFDPQLYWRYLTSSVLGHIVFYTDVIPTTMTVFEGIQFSIPEKVGLIAVAGRQTSGKGRGGNAWLSPVGCAMFTLPLRMPVDSALGQRVSFLQHIAALAVVHSVRSMPGYEDLDLRLKWPNDIYFGDKMKLGGVLVTSTIMDKTAYATVGCGVNVSNSQPTVCINDVIHQHNREQGSNLRPLSTSELLARTVSAMEACVTQFQDKGHHDFCQLYYKYWLHSGAQVKVESEGNADVQICGLDDFGFLRVINKQGEQLSVQPDGNSFDMLRNLITVKRD